MIKILHCADLHLDSPMSAFDIARAEARRNDLRAAFTSMILSVKINKIDFLLIAGDLFDCEFVSKDTIALIAKEFASIPECNVIISPGNHDPYTASGHYRRAEFPDNVYIFDSPELTYFDFPEKNTTVYGWAFISEHMDSCPLNGFSVENESRINILTAHGDLDAPGSSYCNISSTVLAGCGFDYVALGHRHTYTEAKQLGGGYVSYSGCLEGRGFDECGVKGAVLAVAEKDAGLRFAAKFMRFGKRKYEDDILDIEGSRSNADAAEKIASHIAQNHYGEDVALRLHLVGNVSGDFKLSPTVLKEHFSSLFLLEIIDETMPLLDLGKLKQDPTLRGEFYRSLEPLLSSADEKERECAAMALRCGLAALNGNDFTEI